MNDDRFGCMLVVIAFCVIVLANAAVEIARAFNG